MPAGPGLGEGQGQGGDRTEEPAVLTCPARSPRDPGGALQASAGTRLSAFHSEKSRPSLWEGPPTSW